MKTVAKLHLGFRFSRFCALNIKYANKYVAFDRTR